MAREPFTTVISLAGNVDPSLQRAFDNVERRLEGIDMHAVAMTASVVAGFAAIGVGAFQAAKKFISFGNEYNKTMAGLQAKTGATAEDIKGLSEVVKNVYAGQNLGESMQDVADVVSTAKQFTKLSGRSLEQITSDAILLRDTFDYDVNESLRASKAMMTNFGISGEEAMNLIAVGSQNGLDYSGELLDNISEYSVQFKKVGLNANDMFQIMQAGADNGAWNIDKVGDAIKEFSITAIDGSDSTKEAFQALGYNANHMMSVFANGGEGARKAFQQVLNDVISIDDAVERDAIGVALFKTMWEDLGVDAMASLANITDEAYVTSDALKEINKLKYQDIGHALEGVRRQFEVSLAPAASKAAQRIGECIPQITESLQAAAPYIEDLAMKFSDFLVGGINIAIDAMTWCSQHTDILKMSAIGLGIVFAGFTTVKFVNGVMSAVQALRVLHWATIRDKIETLQIMALYAKDAVLRAASTTATVAHTVAMGAWNAVAAVGTVIAKGLGMAIAFLTSPIGLVVIAIGVLIAIGVALYKNWDFVKEKAAEAGAWIANIWTGIKNKISGVWENVKAFTTQFVGFLSSCWENIKLSVGNFIFGIKQAFITGFGALVGIVKAPINGIIGLVNGAINAINGISVDIPEWIPGIGGKHFGMALPNIPMLAKGGFTNGISIAGEAGTEAVLSFDPSVRSQNLSYWAKAGRMLGAIPDGVNPLESSHQNNSLNMGDIVFSPKIQITGNADKNDIITAIKSEYPEFIDLLEHWFTERRYFAYEN